MRGKAKEAGLMKLDKLIAKRQSIPSNAFPIPVKELCERYERLYTGCINCTKHRDPFTCPEKAMLLKLDGESRP